MKFTQREIEVVKLKANDLTDKQIADHLFITKRAVEWRKAQMFIKADVKTSHGLVAYAFRNGFIK